VDIFVDRVVGYIGTYWVKLRGNVDALVFAGGIGEKGKEFREAVCAQVSCLGIGMDKAKNDSVGSSGEDVIEISEGSGVKTLVVKTDEQVRYVIFERMLTVIAQVEMARECLQMEEIWKH